MAVTKETVSSKIQELAKNSIHAAVLEGKEEFELYNALVGTTFDAESYEKVASEAPEYLVNHIPGGAKFAVEDTDESDDQHVPTPEPVNNPTSAPTAAPKVTPTVDLTPAPTAAPTVDSTKDDEEPVTSNTDSDEDPKASSVTVNG